MKKIFQTLAIALMGTFALCCCEDVPAPYPTPGEGNGSNNSPLSSLPYTSSNLLADWTTLAITNGDPWSQGASYTQATGYQKWDGSENKSNQEVEGYLISPSFNTTCESGKVKISFDQTLRYTNQDPDYATHSKIYVSKDYDGTNFEAATWEELTAYTPTPSPYQDWTLYSSGELQLPDTYANQESVYVAFWFYAPKSGSTTWELKNFKMEEGLAENSGTGDDDSSASGSGTYADPYNVAAANKAISELQQSTGKDNAFYTDVVYVKGIISNIDSISTQYGNATYEISEDGKRENELIVYRGVGFDGDKIKNGDIVVGDTVIVSGKLVNWWGTYEFTQGSKIVYQNGKSAITEGSDVNATGKGTLAEPYNVAAVHGLFESGNVPSTEVYVKGKISKIKSLDVSQWVRAQYYISDDGTTANQFYVYNGLYLGGADFTANDQIKVGDEVIICGKLTTYYNTNEFEANNYLVYLNGKTADDQGGNEGGEEDGDDNEGDEVETNADFAFTNISLKDGATGSTTLGKNNYGEQNVDDESTWYTFVSSGIDWAACKVCIAQDTNLGIQMQGNDSDVQKQGFLFNSSALPAIKTIIITLRTATGNKYDPDFNLYAGTSKHPTSNAVTGSMKKETTNDVNIYTITYDLSAGDYTHFTIANDKKGALYIDKVEIYKK